ncbi:hypothetical protein CLIB1444_19S00342 [[Candida] jaroonii]|uniref:Uncharacterized protein n=1 Tax=[Candida] jaroonii TaxID=467808 RepID=A0ACA9YF58_9ASCO|nr:hypothetical protein CLIB1444_19S00342 [[Candida] jaroonii]
MILETKKRVIYAVTAVILIVSLIFTTSFNQTFPHPQCVLNQKRPSFKQDPLRINERNVLFPHEEFILKNATIIDGDGKISSGDILIKNSTITEVGNLNYDNIKTIDLQGKYLTPGLVDCHSHFGTRAQPQLKFTEDTNEYTSPVTPFMRSIDAINPRDPKLASLNANGVTSHLVLTGSKNLLSGESYGIKLHRSPNNLVEEMLLQYNVQADKLVRWFKIAYGENEKASGLPGYPVSRMGESWVLRKAFEQASSLKIKQDKWCQKPQGDYPTDYELDTLVDILRGDLNVNVHLYETYDFETLVRIANEFEFHIGSFHHALSSWEVIKLLKEHQTSVAIFADEWGGKKEQYEATVNAPRILAENHIPVAIKTDHPAFPGQDLLYYAQIAHNFGLPSEMAISAVTSVPAKIMSMNHRIGYIRPGYDADIVVWDNHPLVLGTKTQEVIIDGIPMFQFDKLKPTPPSSKAMQRVSSEINVTSDSFVITGINSSFLRNSTSLNIDPQSQEVVVVDQGELKCIGSATYCTFDSNVPVVNLENGYILPGITAVSPDVGLREMMNEPSTSDGDGSTYSQIIHAKDGLILDGLVLERLQNAGVSQAITAPIGTHFQRGVSTRFSLGEKTLDTSILDEEVAVHFTIGDSAKSPTLPTISSQLKELRDFIAQGKYPHLPIAVHTHSKPVILQIINLKQSVNRKIIIIGGQEAYLVADELSQAEIPVILAPWRCTAKRWENRRCSPNTPLMEESSVNILHRAGVKFAIGQDQFNSVRRTFWEASLAGKAIDGFDLQQTVDLISHNVDEIFGLQESKNLVVFDHNPLEFGATLAFSFSNGRLVKVFPEYEEEIKGDGLFRGI